jgi:hypothetical protein
VPSTNKRIKNFGIPPLQLFKQLLSEQIKKKQIFVLQKKKYLNKRNLSL